MEQPAVDVEHVDRVEDLFEPQEPVTEQPKVDENSAATLDQKPAARKRRKTVQQVSEQVHVLHGKTQHLAYLVHDVDNEAPDGHVLVRYAISRIAEYVEDDRVTPFEVNTKRSSRQIKSKPDYNELSATAGSRIPRQVTTSLAARAFVARNTRKLSPQPVTPPEQVTTSEESTVASEATVSSLSHELDRAGPVANGKLKQGDDDDNGPVTPALAVLAANPPFDRATLQEMTKIERGLADLPGFAWEPFMNDPELPQDYKDYLAELPLVEAIRCQQAMKAFASMTPFCRLGKSPICHDKRSDFLPLDFFDRAKGKGFGLQTIADEWNSGFVTMLKQSMCSFIRPPTGSSSVSKPYFLCLMIDTGRYRPRLLWLRAFPES